MAKATVETIEPTPPPKKVILELNEEEWRKLLTLCSATSSLDSIYSALVGLEEYKIWQLEWYWDFCSTGPTWVGGNLPFPRLK